MKARIIGYWVATVLVAAAMVSGGIGEVTHQPQMMEGMSKLGYPLYFSSILGVWKILGTIAILAPRLPRLKEWAYAGIFFDLTGATISHAVNHDAIGHIITPLVIAACGLDFLGVRPQSRMLARSFRLPQADKWRNAYRSCGRAGFVSSRLARSADDAAHDEYVNKDRNQRRGQRGIEHVVADHLGIASYLHDDERQLTDLRQSGGNCHGVAKRIAE